ncbi:MAG: cation-translocating P-type ATPase [Candidatus Micrarchaeia archaeon]|jgi:Ca2+-transporting ATPase
MGKGKTLNATIEPESRMSGLTQKEAGELLESEGANELPASKKRTIFDIIRDVMREPMFLLLVACGLTYLVVGELSDALMLSAFVLVVIGITVYQERKVERALEALRDLSSPRALVIRDGKQMRISGREVVRGDLLVLAEGDRVPADAVVVSCSNLLIDESLLTGEAVPVRKMEWDGRKEKCLPGGDDLPFVYSSTLIVQGHGIARVLSTGMNTEVGKIGKSLQQIEPEETLLQKETGGLVKKFAIAGALLCLLVIGVFGFVQHDWLGGFLAGLALAMAVLPEEFPVVLTIFLALGAWRMSRHNVLTRSMNAIQNLGSATVLCVDKTGTLTENRMKVKMLAAGGKRYKAEEKGALPERFHELMEYAVLASQKDPFDPMEKALKGMGREKLASTEHLHGDWELMKEYALSKSLLALSHVWRSPSGRDFVIASKGAPEAIIDLCHMGAAERKKVMAEVLAMSGQGLRVLGVARAVFKKGALPSSQHDFEFDFIGLLGFEDPVRKNISASIAECYAAGIRVVMITGDYPGTAKHVAQEAGFRNTGVVITGAELEKMSDAQLQMRIANADIFARVVPEQKLRIVNALKENGEVVVMSGDGVNDAPALKAAHIGIAMGERGTDVARESAALVLLDDNFVSIVKAVRMGRKIYDNIRKAMSYIISIHVPIAGSAIVPVLFGWPLMLFPVHIAFLELIIDPVCSIVFEGETEEKDIMGRKPRRKNEPLFDSHTLAWSAFQGISALIITMGMFLIALSSGRPEGEARALAFTTLVIANLCIILSTRSQNRTALEMLRVPNSALFYVGIAALGMLALVLYVPFMQELFRFTPLSAGEIAMCLVAGALSIAAFEIVKMSNLWKHRVHEGAGRGALAGAA